MNKIIYPIIFLCGFFLCMGVVYLQCLCVENTLLWFNRMADTVSSPYLAWLDKENKEQEQEFLKEEQLKQFDEYLEENEEGINLTEVIKPDNNDNNDKPDNKLSIPPSRYYKEKITYIDEQENNNNYPEPGIAGYQGYRACLRDSYFSWQHHAWLCGI